MRCIETLENNLINMHSQCEKVLYRYLIISHNVNFYMNILEIIVMKTNYILMYMYITENFVNIIILPLYYVNRESNVMII